jgi:hypothetical protein
VSRRKGRAGNRPASCIGLQKSVSASSSTLAVASVRASRRCCQTATTTDSTDAAISAPEIGRVTNSHGSASEDSARMRFASIWSPSTTPRMSGASGMAPLTMP